ncbi:hypothetical protein F511_24924 [Dorcoceras hygrometricum]|uniref:Uncharacterized protein n=1 Tax=Dorcoceras hygrometricum TaxID=472368 RepID=A0A2Z7CQZ3_9LAMI|nr:hypothetical protein F511_24924 [Dorcoceras hygrometricum]
MSMVSTDTLLECVLCLVLSIPQLHRRVEVDHLESSHPQFSGPQFAQVNAMTRERAEGTPGGGIIAGITDSACKNQLVVVSVQYGPFNPYIPIISTTIDSIGYPRMSASGESSTTMHRLLHASGSHPIPTSYDPKTNQYNQDLGLIHSTNGNHLESPKEGSSIDHQVTIYLHAQNITMFPTNETWYFASQILVSNSGGLILIFTAQSTRNMFRIHSDN